MNTDKIYQQVQDWLTRVGPRILIGLVIVFAGLWLIRLLKKWLNVHMLHKDVTSSIRPFLLNLIVTVLQILLVLGFMSIVGIQMTIFAAVIGAFGVAAGLALSGTLQNFTSGILILMLKPFRVGDNIMAQGQEGTVYTIQIFFTVIKTFDNRTVIIPNSKLSNEVIVNLSREGKRRLDIEMKFPFVVDYVQAREQIGRTVEAEKGLLKDPVYRIGVSSLEGDGYRVLVSVWLPAHGFIDARLKLQEQLLTDLRKAGLKLPGL